MPDVLSDDLHVVIAEHPGADPVYLTGAEGHRWYPAAAVASWFDSEAEAVAAAETHGGHLDDEWTIYVEHIGDGTRWTTPGWVRAKRLVRAPARLYG